MESRVEKCEIKRVINPESIEGGYQMTKQEIETLNIMRNRGKTATEIALTLQISVNTVRSYIRRHPMENAVQVECRQCGKPILQVKGRKAKYFCSDKCRNA